ncbi:hypothetical protein FE257_007846 [Aspergillus nanangensis]|uniref:NAD(P)-binding protein n=1 Tax=Aspergillus nanangensis TaxID=2582783 RepID=A0AAD4H050_ASPNN|nr:hypothetical protein FE257_007846 [Aspergillus nanangensis]
MTLEAETAYVTGGANGIGKALVGLLAAKGMKVCVADLNISGAKQWASALNQTHANQNISATMVDVSSWDSQAAAFEDAVKSLGRIDYVFAVAGVAERRALPNASGTTTGPFMKPDFTVYDICGTGMMYTIWLGVQQFRRQKTLSPYGFKGKIICVSSVTGIYSFPGSPVYSAAKHAVVGFVRSYGKVVAQENITLNAVCPGIVETNISSPEFYAEAKSRGCLVKMEHMMNGFEMFMGAESMSGECAEVVAKYGARVVEFPAPSKESAIGRDFVIEKHRHLND